MLKTVKADLGSLSNKHLVDTIFSLGKLHGVKVHKDVTALNKYGDLKFF